MATLLKDKSKEALWESFETWLEDHADSVGNWFVDAWGTVSHALEDAWNYVF